MGYDQWLIKSQWSERKSLSLSLVSFLGREYPPQIALVVVVLDSWDLGWI